MVVVLIVGLLILIIGCGLWARGRAEEKRLGVSVRDINTADVGIDVSKGRRQSRNPLF